MGKDFASADKGRKFSKGGDMKSDMKEDMAMDKAQDKAMIQKAFKQHDAQEHKGGKGTTLKLAKGGNAKFMSFTEKGKLDGMKPVTKMAKGGSSTAAGMQNYKPRRPDVTIDDVVTPEIRAKRKAMTDEASDEMARPQLDRTYEGARTSMRTGGAVFRSSANGIAQRGKTKGTQVKMMRGGAC